MTYTHTPTIIKVGQPLWSSLKVASKSFIGGVFSSTWFPRSAVQKDEPLIFEIFFDFFMIPDLFQMSIQSS